MTTPAPHPSPPDEHGAFRLYPPPLLPLEPSEIHADLLLPNGAPRGGPYAVINAVSTLDGKATLDGRSSPIGSALDRQVMGNIRCAVDAVLVGAGTLRAENLDLAVPPALADKRRRNGLNDQPVFIILKGTQDLPGDRRLYERSLGGQKGGGLIVLGPRGTPSGPLPGGAIFRELSSVSTDGRLAPPEVLRILHEDFAVRKLLVEGGPAVNHAFLSGGHIMEVFLTLAPKISGEPQAPTIVSGAAALPKGVSAARLISVHAATIGGGELFLRYRL